VFEDEWLKTRSAVGSMSLPFQPWSGTVKAVFYKWLRDDLIPRCGGEAEAAQAIRTYCAMVADRTLPPPGDRMPVFRYLGKDFEKLRRAQAEAAPVSETAAAFKAQQEAYRAKRAAEQAQPVNIYIPEQFRAAQ
jgi:hypothetical protein